MGKLDEAITQIRAQQEKGVAARKRRQDAVKADYDYMVASTAEALEPVLNTLMAIKEESFPHTKDSFLEEISDYEGCTIRLLINKKPFSVRMNHNNPHIFTVTSNSLLPQGNQYDFHQIKELEADLIAWAAKVITHT